MLSLPPNAGTIPDVPFVPGVDQGLRAWLSMRQAVRSAKLQGKDVHTIPCDIPYKYSQYWVDVLFSMTAREIQQVYKADERRTERWTPILDESRQQMQLEQFKAKTEFVTFETAPVIVQAAVEHKSMVFISRVVEMGMNLEVRIGPLARTALMLASLHGDLRKVLFLIEHRARINAKDEVGLTAVHLSMQPVSIFHSLDIASSLIAHRARVNAADAKNRTPLHYACIIDSFPLVELLLRHGADISLKDKEERLPIDFTRNAEIHREFGKYGTMRARKAQFIRMNACIVARKFVDDLFIGVQPRCSVCKRTTAKCELLKKEKYTFWLYAHGRLRNEKYNIKQVSTNYVPLNKNDEIRIS